MSSVEGKREELDGETQCDILEHVVKVVNWNRLQRRLKSVLKDISNSAALSIRWSQSNLRSSVQIHIEKRGKLLLSVSLDGMKLSVLKYERPHSKKTNYLRQTLCSKALPCHSIKQLEKLIRSFT